MLSKAFQEYASSTLKDLKISKIEKSLEHLLYSLREILLIFQHEIKRSNLLKFLANLQLCTISRNWKFRSHLHILREDDLWRIDLDVSSKIYSCRRISETESRDTQCFYRVLTSLSAYTLFHAKFVAYDIHMLCSCEIRCMRNHMIYTDCESSSSYLLNDRIDASTIEMKEMRNLIKSFLKYCSSRFSILLIIFK